MRVTHVITRLIVGGAQENTLASVVGLRKFPGFDVDLISGPSSGPEGSLETTGQERICGLTTIPELIRPVHPWKDLQAYRKLEKIFRQNRPDIVHTHSGKAGILGRLAAAHARVPTIIHTIHGPSFGSFQGPFANWLFRAAERYAARVTTHFVTVADAMRNQYLAAGIGQPSQYTRIFSGFPMTPLQNTTNDLALRLHYNIAPDDIVIGKIARLFRLKGHDDLFAIAPKLIQANPKIKFLLVGDGEWRRRFATLACDTGYEKHFIFTGLIPPAQVPAHVGIMDILVHLSTREGLARALPMALAASKPIVAYDCDGANEICHDNETGFLVRPGHLNLLTERLLLLAKDSDLRFRLGDRGRIFVQQNFAVEQMVQQLQQLYQRLAAAAH